MLHRIRRRFNLCVDKRQHRLSFETACLVFDDPLALSRPDPYPHERRWQTLGMAGTVVLIVVHTWPEKEDGSWKRTGRIISERKVTAHERRTYEEGDA